MTPIQGMIEYSTISGVPLKGPSKNPMYSTFQDSPSGSTCMRGPMIALCSTMIATPTRPTLRGRMCTSADMMIMHQPITQITPASM